MIRVGVVGYGYWGPNLVRSFHETPAAEVAAVADRDPARLALLAVRHPAVKPVRTSDAIFGDPAIDAVAIATPAETHYDLAAAALRSGKHVLVEKPLALGSREAERLVALAAQQSRVLMVDHTFVHSGAVAEIRRLIADGAIGEVLFWDSTRTSVDRYHLRVGVLWDLAVHDLAIIDSLRTGEPTAVSATGVSTVPGGLPDLASIALLFAGGPIAHVRVDWLSAAKLRRAVVGGTRGTIVYDGLDAAQPVKVFEGPDWHGRDPAAVHELRLAHRAGRMWAPWVSAVEPLQRVVARFLDCVRSGDRPETDGASAVRISRWIEAATESIGRSGEPLELQSVACR